MISVANDLLNNSLGLCLGTDGRPNTYTDMFTGRLVQTCVFISTFHTHLFKYLWMHTRCGPVRSATPTVDTLVASRLHHPCSLIPPSSPAHYHNTEKSYQKVLSAPCLAISTDVILSCRCSCPSPWTFSVYNCYC